MGHLDRHQSFLKGRAMPRPMSAIALGLALMTVSCADAPFGPGGANRAPASLEIEFPQPLLIEGDSMVIRFAVRDEGGALIPYLPAWVTPSWRVPEAGVLTVAPDGTARANRVGNATVELQVAGLSASAPLRVDPETITLDVTGAYLVQVVQDMAGSIPIMAGRDALLRVFVQGNALVNSWSPPLHVHLYHDGAQVHTATTTAMTPSVPLEVREEEFGWSWNLVIPGELVQPGLAYRLELDPEGTVPRTPESRTRFPHPDGLFQADVRELPPHRVRFVPVLQGPNGRLGNIHAENLHRYLDLFERIFPIPSVEATIRPTFTTTGEADATDGWLAILSELQALRVADGDDRYYYGVVQRAGGGWGGFGYIGHPVAVGFDNMNLRDGPVPTPWASALLAHEVGHNFNRRHAPCGNPTGLDVQYPHPEARIGILGFDSREGLLRLDDLRDIMSYCYDWISDYTYQGVWDFRAREAAHAEGRTAASPAEERPVLLIWGRTDPDGGVVLEPAFRLLGRPSPPPEPGPLFVEGVDDAGEPIFSVSFAGHEVGHGAPGARHFAFTLPIDDADLARLRTLRLRGPSGAAERRSTLPRVPIGLEAPGGAGQEVEVYADPGGGSTVRWDAERWPMALARDAVTGEILAFGRRGRMELPVGVGAVQITLSHGTGSVPASAP